MPYCRVTVRDASNARRSTLNGLEASKLPSDCVGLIRSFDGWCPTPSAQAMRNFWRRYPWVPEMMRRWPGLAVTVSCEADEVGVDDCYKCAACIRHRLHCVRMLYDDELQWASMGV